MASKRRFKRGDTAEGLNKIVRDNLLAKGTDGCIWRYTTICAYVKSTYNDAVVDEKMDYDHIAGLKAILEAVVVDVPVVEVPAMAYREAHGHCSEIEYQRLIAAGALARPEPEYQKWAQRTDVAPSLKFFRLGDELGKDDGKQAELQGVWEEHRRNRTWVYEDKPLLIVYDEPIETVGVNDDSIIKVYELEEPHDYRAYLIAHAVSPAGLVALVMFIKNDDTVRVTALTEYMTIADVPSSWFFLHSYASATCSRMFQYREVGEPLNKKLSFKRKVQKFNKHSKKRISRFPVDYSQMHSVGIDLFPDIAIRRGWVCKHEIESDLTPEEEGEVEKRFREGTHAAVTWSDGNKIEFNINHGHRAIVERFLATRAHQELLAYQADDAEFRQHGQTISALLRQARIIELPWKFYWKQIERAAVQISNYTFLSMGKENYHAYDWEDLAKRWRDLRAVDNDAFEELQNRITSTMQRREWTPELPFPVCWLGYDIPVGGNITRMNDTKGDYLSIAYKLGSNVDPKKDGLPYIYAHLLTKDSVYAFFTLIKEGPHGSEPTHKCFALVEYENEWNHPEAYSAAVLAQTMAFIADHQIVIDQMPKKRHDRALRRISQARNKRVEPMPYYTVYIKDGLYDVKKEPGREGTHGPLTYSHDRAGGTYYKIKRGLLPLSRKDRMTLERPRSDDHGYQIFEDEKPWGEWAEAVKKRGARAKAPHEWMAILKWRRRDTIVRPDLPNYIPSVRRSEKHKEKKR